MSDLRVNVLKNDQDPEETHLKILFNWNHDSTERLFEFKRDKNELLGDCAKRMKINFEKAFSKGKPKKRKHPNEESTAKQIEFTFFHQKEAVKPETKNRDFWLDGSEMHLKVGNDENDVEDVIYTVYTNLPTIQQLKIPNTILTGFSIYPTVEISNGTIVQSKFTWLKSNDKNDSAVWEKVGSNFTYDVAEEDIGCHLKVICEPGDGKGIGLSKEAVSTKPITAGPKNCPFEIRNTFTQSAVPSDQIRIVSYNLLADFYADSAYSQESLFPYCKPRFLAFDYRKLLILKELCGYNADLILLQEVDESFINGGIGPIFDTLGYDSTFLSKEKLKEGLAILYRRSKFSCLMKETHTFSNLLLSCDLFTEVKSKVETNELLLSRISKLKNSLQVLLLRVAPEDSNRLLLVANLHLYSKDDADHIRLIQSYLCFKYIEKMLAKLGEEYPLHTISFVLAGDWNSTPEFGVVRLVNEKKVDSSLEDFRINKAELIDDLVLLHSLDMSSACGFPEYTNYTQNFTGCLDYIFHDRANLKVVEVVPMPKHEEIIKETAIPSETVPSDHLALVCTVQWC